jgi:hypothetical protein
MSPQELLAGGHCMDDELDAFGCDDTDLEHSSGFVSPDQHHQIVYLEYAYRVSVGVSMSLAEIPCLRALATITGSMGIKLP